MSHCRARLTAALTATFLVTACGGAGPAYDHPTIAHTPDRDAFCEAAREFEAAQFASAGAEGMLSGLLIARGQVDPREQEQAKAREKARTLIAESVDDQQRIVDAAEAMAATAPDEIDTAAQTHYEYWADTASWMRHVASGDADPLETPWEDGWLSTVEEAFGDLQRTLATEC